MASLRRNTDDWQMKAVHEQFDVFDSLVVPYKKITIRGNYDLTVAVLEVMRKHLRLNNEYVAFSRSPSETTESVVNTVLEICKLKKENVIEFSFIVIITNQNGNSQGLCKIPIFIVTLGNLSVFIDMNSKMFSSWDAFMRGNGLPACKFCFPVDGRYDFGGKLKIDFASSSAGTQSLVKTSMFYKVVGKIVDVGKVAASCLIKVAPICFKVVSNLLPVAHRFIERLSTMKKEILQLGMLFYEFKTHKKPIRDLMLPGFKILIPLSKLILSEVQKNWVHVKKSLSTAYDELQKMFPRFFASASPSSQHEFLALTERVDSQTEEIEREATEKIYSTTKFSNESAHCRDHENNMSYIEQIFSNSLNDYALHRRSDFSSGGKPFEKTTNDILTVSKRIADEQQITKLDDFKTIFESVSMTVFEEYRHHIDYYSKAVEAAREVCQDKDKFDLNKFNKCFKIEGEPQQYYMQKVLKSTMESLRCKFKVNTARSALKENTKILLIPLWTKHSDDDVDGLYHCIGVPGTGEFSTEALLSVLQESFVNLDIKDATCISVTESIGAITSDKFYALVTQRVNEDNTSEGLLFCERFSQ